MTAQINVETKVFLSRLQWDARGILSKDIVLLAVKVSHLSVELKIFGLLVELINGTNSCAKQLSAEV